MLMFYNDQKKLTEQQWLNSICKQMNLNEFLDMDMPKPPVSPPAIVKQMEMPKKSDKSLLAYKQFFNTFANQNPQVLFYFPNAKKNPEIFDVYSKFKSDLESLGINWSSVVNDDIKDLETFKKGYELYKKLPEAIKQNIIVHHASHEFEPTPAAMDAQRAIRQSLTGDIEDQQKLTKENTKYHLHDW